MAFLLELFLLLVARAANTNLQFLSKKVVAHFKHQCYVHPSFLSGENFQGLVLSQAGSLWRRDHWKFIVMCSIYKKNLYR